MKLMQLELKKINWRPYLGAACGLLAFGLFIALPSRNGAWMTRSFPAAGIP